MLDFKQFIEANLGQDRSHAVIKSEIRELFENINHSLLKKASLCVFNLIPESNIPEYKEFKIIINDFAENKPISVADVNNLFISILPKRTQHLSLFLIIGAVMYIATGSTIDAIDSLINTTVSIYNKLSSGGKPSELVSTIKHCLAIS